MIILSAIVAITLISSVVVSFTLIPSLADKFLKLKNNNTRKKEGRVSQIYSKIVSWIVKKKRHSVAIIILFLFMFVGSLALVTKIPMTIMPDVFNRYAEIVVNVETGLTPSDKESLVEEIDKVLSSIKDVETSYVMDNGDMFYTIINMTKGDEITRDQKEVNEEVFRALRELEETEPIVSVQGVMDEGGGHPVQVNIKGEQFDELQSLATAFTSELENIDGIVGISHSMERSSVEERIELNEDELEKAGLTSFQVRQFLEQAFLQVPAGEMTIEEQTIPIVLTWEEATEKSSDLLNLNVPTLEGDKKLSRFIDLQSVDTPNNINRIDGERYISVTADIEGVDLGTINRDVQNLINDFEVPTSYSISVAGDLEQQQELIVEMLLILGLAIFLVYFVMAVQFNHLIQPFIVMSIIPMTIVGVILGLVVTQRELSIMSAMGVIMLIGIVLNNAILLIDRTNQLQKANYRVEDALVEAGKNRIRPIFMTTLTTAGGMLPLALATGTTGNYQAPMATVIISGLLFATFITLLLIPAVYKVFSSSEKGIRKLLKRDRKKKNAEVNEMEV